MSKIPHPFIVESIKALYDVSGKSGVYFIHLNHTNPALNRNSNATKVIMQKGFNVASRNQIFHL
jgi:pyrroloquinoline quinone biosynthesis protein B